MTQKLLSIAIPTWNRASVLEQALEKILSQVNDNQDQIQVVISDNASSDETQSVIKYFINKYPKIEIISFLQSTNTGFFGNFCKVKELSTSKFIWMLSDDDFVSDNLLSEIIKALSINNDISLIFLNDWQYSPNGKKISTKEQSVDQIISKQNYRLTLISSVIYINKKENDNYLTTRFHNSNFIGFIFLIDAIRNNNEALIMYGNSINVGNDVPKGYNWFQAFITDINKALNYMTEIGYNKHIIKRFKYYILNKLIVYRYSILKAFAQLDGGLETWDIKTVNKMIFEYYIDSVKSFIIFIPVYLTPALLIKLKFNLEKRIKLKIKSLLQAVKM